MKGSKTRNNILAILIILSTFPFLCYVNRLESTYTMFGISLLIYVCILITSFIGFKLVLSVFLSEIEKHHMKKFHILNHDSKYPKFIAIIKSFEKKYHIKLLLCVNKNEKLLCNASSLFIPSISHKHRYGLIFVTSRILSYLSKDSQKFLVGSEQVSALEHELGHIRNHDDGYLKMFITISDISIFIDTIILSLVSFNFKTLFINIILSLVYSFIIMLLYEYISRDEEYLADDYAVKSTQSPRLCMNTLLAICPTSEILCAINKKFNYRRIFWNHPLIDQRIKNMKSSRLHQNQITDLD